MGDKKRRRFRIGLLLLLILVVGINAVAFMQTRTMTHYAVQNRFDAIGLPSFPAAQLMVFWGSVQLGYNGFGDNPISYAASVQCPVLFMYGTADPRVTARQSEAIYARLNPPGGKTSVAFQGLGHESLLAGDKLLWGTNVTPFLRTVSGSKR